MLMVRNCYTVVVETRLDKKAKCNGLYKSFVINKRYSGSVLLALQLALCLVSVEKAPVHTSIASFLRTVSLTSDDHHTVYPQTGVRVYDPRLDTVGDDNAPRQHHDDV